MGSSLYSRLGRQDFSEVEAGINHTDSQTDILCLESSVGLADSCCEQRINGGFLGVAGGVARPGSHLGSHFFCSDRVLFVCIGQG